MHSEGQAYDAWSDVKHFQAQVKKHEESLQSLPVTKADIDNLRADMSRLIGAIKDLMQVSINTRDVIDTIYREVKCKS